MFMINTTASVKIEKSMKNSQEIGVGGSVVVARVGTGVFIAAGVPGKWKPSKHSYGSLIKVTFEAFYRGSRSSHKLRAAVLCQLGIWDGGKWVGIARSWRKKKSFSRKFVPGFLPAVLSATWQTREIRRRRSHALAPIFECQVIWCSGNSFISENGGSPK